jgi:hypothetical protein
MIYGNEPLCHFFLNLARGGCNATGLLPTGMLESRFSFQSVISYQSPVAPTKQNETPKAGAVMGHEQACHEKHEEERRQKRAEERQ